MDSFKHNTIKILQEYNDITFLGVSELDCIIFKLKEKKYGIVKLDDKCFPVVVAIDNPENYPHFMLSEATIGTSKWRSICLFESGTMVEYIHTEVEKIRMCIDRLLHLVSLSQVEIESEYHKEFIVYWRKFCAISGTKQPEKYQLFLSDSENYQWLELHKYNNSNIRITSSSRYFNDSDKRICIDDIPALYLPIVDARELFPPFENRPWDARVINDIIGGLVYQRISTAAFFEIAQKKLF